MQARIAELWIYPIKGCAGTRLSTAQALTTGLQHDRCMMVVQAQTGRFITQRSHPKMALIRADIQGHQLQLRSLSNNINTVQPLTLALTAGTQQQSVTVWGDTLPAIDMGAEAAAWFSAALGGDLRLARFDSAQQRSVKNNPEITHHFADGYPYLVLSKASVHALNERLMENGAAAVGADRFRANIVIDGVDAHTEDYASCLHLPNGNAINLLAPCTRCGVPDIDQSTGIASAAHEPSLTLAQYRYDKSLDGVTFGMNASLSIANAGVKNGNSATTLREGDVLDVQLSF